MSRTRKKPVEHDSCTVIRTYLVKHGTLGGVVTHEEWVTGPCNTPLFGPDSKKEGVCGSCKKGWTHPENYPGPKRSQ